MGIKVVGPFCFQELGITLNDAVITLNGQVHLTKLIGPQRTSNLPYRLRSEYSVWASELAYSQQYNEYSQCKPILKTTVYTDVDGDAIKGDLLNILYSHLKQQYPTAIDC